MINVLDKIVEKIKKHILCSVLVFENRAVYEIMWKHFVEPERLQMTVWRLRISWWIPKAKNIHIQNFVIIIAFPLQQWLHERASMLRYTYIVPFFRIMCVFRQLTDATSACRDVEPRGTQCQLSVRALRCSRPKTKSPNTRKFTCYRQQNLC
jgi:hypothetical protein